MDLQQQRGEKLNVRIIANNDAIMPHYAHDDDVGMDLYSTQTIYLKPLERKLIPTGLRLELPNNLEAQIRPKSGLAIKHGITMLNTPGTIDPGYRGEVKVIAINLSDVEYIVKKGEKIAQMVFGKIIRPNLIKVDELADSKRGEGGFGSTGLKKK